MWMACYGQQEIADQIAYSAAAIREASFAGRGGAVMALGAVDLSFRGEVWGRISGCRCSPASEVLSSPQMLGEDIETKGGIFPGKVIIVEHGSDC
jgi:hypothetical protein